MALFAKSNVDRFQEEGCGSGLGPGDYDACVPKSTGHAAGVASLGFTSGKALASSQRDENIPEETEAIFSAVRDRRPGIGVAALSSLAPRRASIAGSRPSLVGGASKLNKVEAEHQSRHLAWSERERGKIEAELAKLRAREATLVKSERQARADSAKAISTRNAWSKRAEAAERKAASITIDTDRLKVAEARISHFTGEATQATRAAEEASIARDTLQRERDELKDRLKEQTNIAAQAAIAAQNREDHLREKVAAPGAGGEHEASQPTSIEDELLRTKAALRQAEANLVASASEKTSVEHALCEERSAVEDLQKAVDDTLKRLEKSEADGERMSRELNQLRSQLTAADDSKKSVEEAMAETVESAAALQQRLGDALAEGVEYADQSIRSEERLRNSEADCAALWEEREDANERLRAAFVEGRALEDQLEKTVTEVATLREELHKSKARLATSIQDGDEIEEELAVSNQECAKMKKMLEKVSERHATASSEARLLNASCEEIKADVARLQGELDGVEAKRAESDADGDRLREMLALCQEQKEVAEEELVDAFAQVDTAASDFVNLEASLRDAESNCQQLRSELASTETTLSEATVGAERTREDLHDALRRCTDMQEKLSEADDRVTAAESERRVLEETLSASEARGTNLERALGEAEDKRMEAVAAGDRLGGELKETSCEIVRLQQGLEESESRAAKLGEELAEALADRGVANDEIAGLQSEKEEMAEKCVALLEAKRAAVERAEQVVVALREMEKRMEEVGSELHRLQGAMAEKDRCLEDTSANAAEISRKASDYEAEGMRLLSVLDEIEVSYAAGNETTAGLKQEVANIQGLGVQLADKLTFVVSERNRVQAKLEVSQAALTASAAHRRRLERDLDSSEATVGGVRQENEALRTAVDNMRKECEYLEEAGRAQAMGASAMLAKSEAREDEAVARLQVMEVKSAQEIATANKEAQRARSELDAASSDRRGMRGISNGLCRTRPEGEDAIKMAGTSGRQVQRLTSEDAALTADGDNKKKAKHLQDLRNQNVRLLKDKEALASELALATSVLEAVGVIQKEESAVGGAATTAARRGRQQGKAGATADSEEVGRLLHTRGSASDSTRGGVSDMRRSSDNSSGIAGMRLRRKTSPTRRALVSAEEQAAVTPRSKVPRVALHERLVSALESTAPAQEKRAGSRILSISRNNAKRATTGCFPSIKCGITDRTTTALDPANPSIMASAPASAHLNDERVRNDVRRALDAQAEESNVKPTVSV